MSIYPTLTDLCGLPTPDARRGQEHPPAAGRPAGRWDRPAVTTYRFNNHAVRTEGWRYIRYADGGEELYDEAADPLEHTNLAAKPEHAARKKELAQSIPSKNAADIGGKGKGAMSAPVETQKPSENPRVFASNSYPQGESNRIQKSTENRKIEVGAAQNSARPAAPPSGAVASGGATAPTGTTFHRNSRS